MGKLNVLTMPFAVTRCCIVATCVYTCLCASFPLYMNLCGLGRHTFPWVGKNKPGWARLNLNLYDHIILQLLKLCVNGRGDHLFQDQFQFGAFEPNGNATISDV